MPALPRVQTVKERAKGPRNWNAGTHGDLIERNFSARQSRVSNQNCDFFTDEMVNGAYVPHNETLLLK